MTRRAADPIEVKADRIAVTLDARQHDARVVIALGAVASEYPGTLPVDVQAAGRCVRLPNRAMAHPTLIAAMRRVLASYRRA